MQRRRWGRRLLSSAESPQMTCHMLSQVGLMAEMKKKPDDTAKRRNVK
jgi:hypothetical protein